MGTSRTLRDAPPAHYIGKIESFSLLTKTNLRKYESGVFEVGSYKWRLCLYPNGHRGGNDHVSLYLVIADPQSLETNWEANVNFKMFVFNNDQAKYLTIQDDGKVWQFNAANLEWGYPQLLSKEELGYFLDDRFTYGVELSLVDHTDDHVISSPKCETFSKIKNPDDATYSWKITKFSDRDRKLMYSDMFTVAGYKWHLVLYPDGYQSSKGKYLSVFLKLAAESSILPHGQKIYVDFKVRIVNHFGEKNHALRDEHWFSSESDEYGFKDHMPLSDLADISKGFIMDDTIILEARILSITQIN